MTLPARLTPMFATASKELPPDDDRWGFEVKWDGVRAIVFVENGTVRVQSRNLLDVTDQYPELRGIADSVGAEALILDGEIVAPDEDGRPQFSRLQQRMHIAGPSAALLGTYPVCYIVFDLLHLGDDPTMALPYTERRARLEALALQGASWQTPGYHAGYGASVLAATRGQGLEGVVAKRLDSTYEPGRRSRAWLKIKNQRRQEFVIAGWSAGSGNREGRIGALLLGYHEGDDLRYAGHVGTGFTGKMLTYLEDVLAPLKRDTSPFTAGPPPARLKRVTWVEPKLVCEVEFTEWTTEGVLRHPSFKGLRDDKDPREVVREPG